MNKGYHAVRRSLRPLVKSLQAILRWRRLKFDEAPPIFGNAKPKSGSHLLYQILSGYTRIMPYRYVEAEPIRTITAEGRRRTAAEILADLKRLPRGVIGWGYLEASPENIAFLVQPGRVNYFLYRDPRDMLVSHVFFATEMHPGHGMHAYYNALPDFNARLKVAITGIDQDGLRMVSVRQRYEDVFRWLETPGVMCIRFEDLVERRAATLQAMLDEVEKSGYRIPTPREEALRLLMAAIQPRRSATFRSGKSGTWRQYFTEEHKRLFKEVAGDLLIRLGYETDNDW
jgi:hypothetical protein